MDGWMDEWSTWRGTVAKWLMPSKENTSSPSLPSSVAKWVVHEWGRVGEGSRSIEGDGAPGGWKVVDGGGKRWWKEVVERGEEW